MLLTEVLRDRWSFDGFVVTDWGAVKGTAKGVAAGLDLEMPGGPNATGEEIVEAVKAGTLSESALDKAVLNLLHFVETSLSQHDESAVIDRDDCRKLAKRRGAVNPVPLRILRRHRPRCTP
jgi:beta-glucosidase